jgi:N,N-dimethylformamidase
MWRDVIHEAMGVVGYAEPWSAAPGARRSLSLSTDRPIDAVRIRRLDRDGMPEMDWPVETLPDLPAHRSLSQGSWLHVDGADLALMGTIQHMSFELLLTRNDRLRVLLDAESFSLCLSGDLLIYRQGEGDIVIGHLPPRQWLEVRLDLSGKISILSLDSFRPFALSAQLPASTAISLSFCSDRGQTLPTLNCRLARIAVAGRDGAANWLFPTMFTQDALLAHGIAMPLVVAGNPTFCVTSSRWDGTSLDPRLTPSHYDAIHFHDTDMAGFDWPASFGLVVPADAQSGIYAFEIVAGTRSSASLFSSRPPSRKHRYCSSCRRPPIWLMPTNICRLTFTNGSAPIVATSSPGTTICARSTTIIPTRPAFH